MMKQAPVKKQSAQKPQKRKMTTKKAAPKKKVVAKKAVTKSTASVSTKASTAAVTASPSFSAHTAALPQLNLDFKSAFAPTKNTVLARASAFKKTAKLFNEVAVNEPSPTKIMFQAQKFLQNDANALAKELNTAQFESDLADKDISYKVSNEGIVTVLLKRIGYDVECVFDREFEYVDEQDQEEENNDQEGAEGGEEGKYAFHNLTVTLSKKGLGSLRLGGQLHLNGDLKIQTFTPYQESGSELRTVSTEDLSDGSINALFDALESVCLSDETCSALLEIGRTERLKTHLQSIDFLVSFLGTEH